MEASAVISSPFMPTVPLILKFLMAAFIEVVSSIFAVKSLILRIILLDMTSSLMLAITIAARPLMEAAVFDAKSVYLIFILLSINASRSIKYELSAVSVSGSVASSGGKMSKLLLPSLSKKALIKPLLSWHEFTIISSSNKIFLRFTDTIHSSMAARVSVVQPLVGLISTRSLISSPTSGNVLNKVRSTLPILYSQVMKSAAYLLTSEVRRFGLSTR